MSGLSVRSVSQSLRGQKEVYFSGRVFFDHAPKTAGMSIQSWISRSLGTGSVTKNLNAPHRELINRFGGSYPVIVAHAAFRGEGLDPRYTYLTCLREPVDRALSWLYFARSHPELNKDILYSINVFLETNGEIISNQLLPNISEWYINHFAAVDNPFATSDEEKLSCAIESIFSYEGVGFYEKLPEFVIYLAKLLGIDNKSEFPKINTTESRPNYNKINPKLLDRLTELNSYDIKFYEKVRLENKLKYNESENSVKIYSGYSGNYPVEYTNKEIEIMNFEAYCYKDTSLRNGTRIKFLFSSSKNIEKLIIGIAVHDEIGLVVFGTNTAMMNKVLFCECKKLYGVTLDIDDISSSGIYSVTVAFQEKDGGFTRELLWQEDVIKFTVSEPATREFIGYAQASAVIDIQESLE